MIWVHYPIQKNCKYIYNIKYLNNYLFNFYEHFTYFNIIRNISNNQLEAIPTSVGGLTNLKQL